MTETELADRLERLERDNRRLKGFALGVLVLAGALCGIYATQPVPDKITAHEFDVVDSSGRVRVAVADMDRKGQVGGFPTIALYDAKGGERVELSWGTGLARLTFLGGKGNPLAMLSAQDEPSDLASPALLLIDGEGKSVAQLTVARTPSIFDLDVPMGHKAGGPRLLLLDRDTRSSLLASVPSEPSITLLDSQGFGMDLGTTTTENGVTGESQKTTAASIILFGKGKDHHVIWKAP